MGVSQTVLLLWWGRSLAARAWVQRKWENWPEVKVIQKTGWSIGLMTYTYNPRSQETEAEITLSLRAVWFTEWVPGLQNEILSQSEKKKWMIKKKKSRDNRGKHETRKIFWGVERPAGEVGCRGSREMGTARDTDEALCWMEFPTSRGSDAEIAWLGQTLHNSLAAKGKTWRCLLSLSQQRGQQ